MVKVKILTLKEEYKEYETRPQITTSEDVYKILKPMFLESQESLIMISLNTKNKVLTIRTISTGTLNANIVHPRDIFKAAIIDNACAVIVAHNHPSGDPAPSKEDIKITHKLSASGEILGIKVIDHIIIGDERHVSLNETGQMGA